MFIPNDKYSTRVTYQQKETHTDGPVKGKVLKLNLYHLYMSITSPEWHSVHIDSIIHLPGQLGAVRSILMK